MPDGSAAARSLGALARAYGVWRSYEDAHHRRHWISRRSLLGVLSGLGAPVETLADVPDALRARHRELWERVVEPVAVAWEGRLPSLEVRVPARLAEAPVLLRIEPEEDGPGDPVRVRLGPEEAPVARAVEVDGAGFVSRTARPSLPRPLPLGYHRLEVSVGRTSATATVVAAPRRAPDGGIEREWGVFLPLHALHTRRSWGVGDLSDLQELAGWVGELGGGVVATLPLLAGYLRELFEASPYSPASRLFWNELYLDVTRLPEADRSPEVRAVLDDPALRREVAEIRRLPLVDHRRAMAAKRRVLEAAARSLFAEDSPRRRELLAHARSHPLLSRYARFRSIVERREVSWEHWPGRQRDGRIDARDGDPEAERYHRYVQWVAAEQIDRAGSTAREHGPGLYLDMPLAVNPSGFDVWQFRDSFALGARAGAPPDMFFSKGQDWGFPPLHPERTRWDGHRYLRRVLDHVMGPAGVVRMDHVMGLYRLYWIPPGLGPLGGAYVRYPQEELFAVVTLEAHRHGVAVVGEDLGTVPSAVRRAMARHGLYRSYVAEFAFRKDRRRAMAPAGRGMFASIDTHDLPPFASYWEARDVPLRRGLGFVTEGLARRQERDRARIRRALVDFLRRRGWVDPPSGGVGSDEDLLDPRVGREVLAGCLAMLAAGDARVVVATLEDLWWETRPQNVPGTGSDRPNWRPRARYPLEEARRMPEVVELLRRIDRLRGREAKR